ncbi:MAG: ankyrin repeat domain-containing protein [Bacteroidales bacterium]|nr:ankyrin repeat domain-containing protein [Bacteroidales bacterium]MBN2699662.1 ankyrin repeat domain-containing protein [Bacteroidales bacterium]
MKSQQIILSLLILTLLNPVLPGQTDKDFNKYAKFINANRPDKITKLINRGKNINATNNAGKTPLLFALEKDRVAIADVLITSGADIHMKDSRDNGCLHYAIENSSSLNIIYRLVDHGANIDQANSDLYTPYHFSLLFKCPEISKYLMDKGADYKKVTAYEEGPIHLAAQSGCIDMVEELIQLGLDYDRPDVYGNTPFLFALKNDRRAVSGRLMDLGVNLLVKDSAHYTPVFYAVENNDSVIFNRLIEQDVEVDVPAEGKTPIVLAAFRDNADFVKKLLLKGAKNPMNCNIHDECYVTAFIYSMSAELADPEEQPGLYQNSLNIYNMALEKYRNALNKIRAKNTGKFCGEVCLLTAASLATGYIYAGSGVDYEKDERDYLKNRMDICELRIAELEAIVNPVQ